MRNLPGFHKKLTWQPWENTIVYYPLTSTTTVNDMSGNNRNLTQVDKSTFWTYWGINCVYVSWSSQSWLHCLYTIAITNSVLWTKFTEIFWCKRDTSKDIWCWMGWLTGAWDWYNLLINSSWNLVNEIQNNGSMNNVTYSWWISAWTRNMVTATYDNWSCKIYLNWNSVWSGIYTVWTISILWIWCRYGTETAWYTYQDNWYLSNYILENKVRTAQEISDYYKNTKKNYWL